MAIEPFLSRCLAVNGGKEKRYFLEHSKDIRKGYLKQEREFANFKFSLFFKSLLWCQALC